MQDDPSPFPIRWIGIATDHGKYRLLTTVDGLAEALMGSWPDDQEGDVWEFAIGACLRALETQTNGDAAREAFILAAREANVSLILDPSMLKPPGSVRATKKPIWRPPGAAAGPPSRKH
jgi:hypothetical protein